MSNQDFTCYINSDSISWQESSSFSYTFTGVINNLYPSSGPPNSICSSITGYVGSYGDTTCYKIEANCTDALGQLQPSSYFYSYSNDNDTMYIPCNQTTDSGNDYNLLNMAELQSSSSNDYPPAMMNLMNQNGVLVNQCLQSNNIYTEFNVDDDGDILCPNTTNTWDAFKLMANGPNSGVGYSLTLVDNTLYSINTDSLSSGAITDMNRCCICPPYYTVDLTISNIWVFNLFSTMQIDVDFSSATCTPITSDDFNIMYTVPVVITSSPLFQAEVSAQQTVYLYKNDVIATCTLSNCSDSCSNNCNTDDLSYNQQSGSSTYNGPVVIIDKTLTYSFDLSFEISLSDGTYNLSNTKVSNSTPYISECANNEACTIRYSQYEDKVKDTLPSNYCSENNTVFVNNL